VERSHAFFRSDQTKKERLLKPEDPEGIPVPAQSLTDTETTMDESKDEDWVPLSKVEGRYVARVLEHTGGNKQAAARILEVDRKTLDRMIKRHHIECHHMRGRRATVSRTS
jgi:DNA-binding NtrC family response regulator